MLRSRSPGFRLNVLGVSQTPSSTDAPASSRTRTRYNDGAGTLYPRARLLTLT